MVKGKEYRKDSHDTAAIPAHYQVDKPSRFHTEREVREKSMLYSKCIATFEVLCIGTCAEGGAHITEGSTGFRCPRKPI